MLSPAEVARRYVAVGEKKAEQTVGRTFLLAVLAGVFIALAGTASTIGGALSGKLAAAAIFPAGLAMVVVAGSELFTGNSLLVIPVLERKIGAQDLLRNWGVVYLGNLVGAVLIAGLTVAAGTYDAVWESVIATATAKAALPFAAALLRGVLCNVLVCVAVWMTFAAESVTGKIAGLYLPILAFVLCGFEHSVANMFYLPAGIFAGLRYGAAAPGLYGMWVNNLLPVTLGNLIGGCAVGAAYWAVYLRQYGRHRADQTV